MRCSVVFGVTLRLLIVNISSSSFAINTAAYYQRCVTLNLWYSGRGPPATVLTTPACCCVNIMVVKKPDIGSESRFMPTLPAFDAPVRGEGYPSEYCYAVSHRKSRMVWLPDGEKILMICLFVLTEFTNVTDTHTHLYRLTDFFHYYDDDLK